jgi:hypothetical protein
MAVVAVMAAVMSVGATTTAAAAEGGAGAGAGAGAAGRRALLGERNHSYKKGEEVKLYANKVGPFHNPR